ncbi:MAG TPA: methylated-DNA--[protein]-cysteine S-methyltransferase [Thermoleophilaceae bacterium]|nr:methylated-DNA--[protein]-cysteine S-methyltransferase [Thermoleophilaceae bacterium]
MSARILIDTPLGPLVAVAAGDGGLRSLAFDRHCDGGHRLARAPARGMLADTRRQLSEYFAGERTTFELPLSAGGTPFQQRVWRALAEIPYGETVSYGELAAAIGAPGAARAVGLANGRNPIPIVVPCHRVVGSDGRLTGYGGGLERKRVLLALEQRRA